jgi:ribosomal protein S12 methylthiotransferase accessory factor
MAATIELGSSLRMRPAAATLARARRLMPALGISRVSDITRMDRLGLPVYTSIRPLGRALCVHAGKGLRAEEAEVGALMEAVEFAAADAAASPWRRLCTSVGELAAQFGDGLRLVDFAPLYGRRIEAGQRITAVACEALGGARGTVALPAELVFVPWDGDAAGPLFGWSSNGLASGNTVEEATVHALFEVMERDTLAMNRAADASLAVDLATLPEPYPTLAAGWRAQGVELAVRWLPGAFGLPCFGAWLHERHSEDVDIAGGSGLHLLPHIALARAVCEAAQSRLSLIHGGRDDITRFYAQRHGPQGTGRREAASQVLGRIFDRTRCIDYAAVPAGPTPAATLPALQAQLLTLLHERGFADVFRHRFELDLDGLAVVKVVVPRCENTEQGVRRIGPRLLAQALAHA